MRSLLLLMAIAPALASANGVTAPHRMEKEIAFDFSIEDSEGDFLSSEEFDAESLSCFVEAIDDEEGISVPWTVEDDGFKSSGVMPPLYAKSAKERDLSEAVTYEKILSGETATYSPSLEHVPESSQYFFAKPRVVEATPVKEGKKR